ncbi:MAG: cache domain-containing protein, partial [Victivallaceae bacterium]
RAQRFDRNFLYFGAELDALGEFAERLLTMNGELPQQKVYQQDDFSLYRQSPPDIIYSPYYKRPISMSEIAFKLAPGVSTSDASSTLQRLSHMKSFFSRAVKNLGPEYSQIAPDEKIVESGGTVTGIYIGTQDGVFGYFPGNRHFPPEYDPRRRPWYISGSSAALPRWGRSYLSPSGAGIVIPCARRLQNETAKTIGVIGMEISHERIRSLLDTSRNGERKYLVTADGLLVLTDHPMKSGTVNVRNDGLLEPRHFALSRELAEIIKESPDGGARVLGKEYLIVAKLQSLNLYYVETIPLANPAI